MGKIKDFQSRKNCIVNKALKAESKDWVQRVGLRIVAEEAQLQDTRELIDLVQAAYEEGFYDATSALIKLGYKAP